MSALPSGFTLDDDQGGSLPDGFTLDADAPAREPTSLGKEWWEIPADPGPDLNYRVNPNPLSAQAKTGGGVAAEGSGVDGTPHIGDHKLQVPETVKLANAKTPTAEFNAGGGYSVNLQTPNSHNLGAPDLHAPMAGDYALAPATYGQVALGAPTDPTGDPFMQELRNFIAPPPNTYTGEVMPYRRDYLPGDKEDAPTGPMHGFVMPMGVRSLATGALDLLEAPQTGVVTPEATMALSAIPGVARSLGSPIPLFGAGERAIEGPKQPPAPLRIGPPEGPPTGPSGPRPSASPAAAPASPWTSPLSPTADAPFNAPANVSPPPVPRPYAVIQQADGVSFAGAQAIRAQEEAAVRQWQSENGLPATPLPDAGPPLRDAMVKQQELQAILNDPRSYEQMEADRQAQINGRIATAQSKLPNGFTIQQDPQLPGYLQVIDPAGRSLQSVPSQDGSPAMLDQLVDAAHQTIFDGVDYTPYFRQGTGTQDDPVRAFQPTDVAAAAAFTAQPTQAQAQAGNYQMGHVQIGNLPVTIETPAGGTRSGVDPNGQPWSVTMPADYGYIRGTRGADGDHLDVYLGPHAHQAQDFPVFVIDQKNVAGPNTHAFDEHKVMLGFPNEATALHTYNAAFDDSQWNAHAGAVTPMSFTDFQRWSRQGGKGKPFAYLPPQTMVKQALAGSGINLQPQHIQQAADAIATAGVDPVEAIGNTVDLAALEHLISLVDQAAQADPTSKFAALPEGLAPIPKPPQEIVPHVQPAPAIGNGPGPANPSGSATGPVVRPAPASAPAGLQPGEPGQADGGSGAAAAQANPAGRGADAGSGGDQPAGQDGRTDGGGEPAGSGGRSATATAEAGAGVTDPPKPTRIRTIQEIVDQDKVTPRRAAIVQANEIAAIGQPISDEERQARKAGVAASKPAPRPTPPPPAFEETVSTATGRKIKVKLEVVPEQSLVAASGDLQPRDRAGRLSSDAQITNMAAHLDPARLGSSPEADRGAPIVGPDGVVESGNGRVEAIRQALRVGGAQADAYRAMVQVKFPGAGPNDILIRRRVTQLSPDERRAFVAEANQSATQRMSAPEQAAIDARSLSHDLLGRLDPDLSGGFSAAGNRDFVRAWVATLPEAERNAILDQHGVLSAEGVRRLDGAMLARAYGSPQILARSLEATDDSIKGITGALLDAAPAWARLQSDIHTGHVPAVLDIAPDLIRAVDLIRDARSKNRPAAEILGQSDAFNPMPPLVEALIRAFFDPALRRPLARPAIAEVLRTYADEADKQQAAEGLFGAGDKLTPSEILRAAVAKREGRRMNARTQQQGSLLGAPGQAAASPDIRLSASTEVPRRTEKTTDSLDQLLSGELAPSPERGQKDVGGSEPEIKQRAAPSGWGDVDGGTEQDQSKPTQAAIDAALDVARQITGHKIDIQAIERGGTIGGRISGVAVGRIVRVSVDNKTPWNLHHEAIHALRNLGVLTPSEWSTLTAAAERQGWLKEFGIEGRPAYADIGPEKRLEEAIAEKFAQWSVVTSQQPIGGMAKVMRKVTSYFERVRNRLAGQGFRTAGDVFETIKSGEAGAREPGSADATRGPLTVEDTLAMLANRGIIGGDTRAGAEAFFKEMRLSAGDAPEPPKKQGIAADLLRAAGANGAVTVLKERFSALRTTVSQMVDSSVHPNPMKLGSDRAQAMAKDTANAIRLAHDIGQRTLFRLGKDFTPADLRQMWDAMDAESVAAQIGEPVDPAKGVDSLTQPQRAAVDAAHARANAVWEEARAAGLHDGPGLPWYVPRMVIGFGTEEGPAVVRDFRTLVLATMRLQEAIAGKVLIDNIKEIGRQTGSQTVAVGHIPGNPLDPFTGIRTSTPNLRQRKHTTTEETEAAARRVQQVDQQGRTWHTIPQAAAFYTWRFDGVDAEGEPTFRKVPIYVADEFIGPLRSIMRRPANGAYKFLMRLKGAMMTAIMYGVAHLGVTAFRVAPMVKGNPIALVMMGREGYLAKQDDEVRERAIKGGLVPIGRHSVAQDAEDIAELPNIKPGRGWAAQLVGLLPSIVSKKAGDATKRAVDRAGDFTHGTLMWDRVADLQFGVYARRERELLEKGVKPEDAARVAADLANIITGAIPREAMSQFAEGVLNLALFSRSYRLSILNMGKRAVTGLPGPVKAQIERDSGVQAMLKVSSMARRTMIATILVDLALFYASNSLVQSAVNVLMLGTSPQKEAAGYVKRLWSAEKEIASNPLLALNPLAVLQELTPMASHEPGKQNRILYGYEPDGTGKYFRSLMGKFGEDMTDYVTQPQTTLGAMESPYIRAIHGLLTNDAGFGRQIADPYIDTPGKFIQAAGDYATYVLGVGVPKTAIQSAANIVTGKGTSTDPAQIVTGAVGLAMSHGYPGGPAMGEAAEAKRRHNGDVQRALPDIRAAIKAGDQKKGIDMMVKLGMPVSEIRYVVMQTLQPHLSGRQIARVMGYMTPEAQQKFLADMPGAP